MENAFVKNYTKLIQSSWGHREFQLLLETMAADKGLEQWLEVILSVQDNKELFRDPEEGFVLTAYTENKGQYRKPHDHGHCWVIYAVMSGTIEMGTFGKTSEFTSEILRKSLGVLNSGDSRIYLKGDIHDTHCLSDRVIILRFTSCDLRVEEKEGRMRRYNSV
jgi:hypothetical protein